MKNHQKTIKKTNRITALYVHIPFCDHICSYCDFCKILYKEDVVSSYLSKLKKELESAKVSKKLKSIYVGGGTPSSLNLNSLETLLEILKPYQSEVIEYTFEANPESLSVDKIKLLKKYGVNRISLGIESFNDEILKILNRKHNYAIVKEVINNLKSEGLDNFNLDLIVGLPKQSKKILLDDLNTLVEFKPKHLSCYALSVNPHTKFYLDHVKELDDDLIREYLDLVHNFLKEHHYHHYEISNYALDGFESIHNKTYWKDEEYYAVGLGSSGYVNGIRFKNTLSLNKYLTSDEIRIEEEKISLDDDFTYYIMLNLRMKNGFSDEDFKEHFHYSFLNKYQDKIKEAKDRGLLEVQGTQIYPTYEGMMLLDTLTLLFI